MILCTSVSSLQIFLKDKKPEERSKASSEFQTQYGPTLERQKAEELQRSLSEELKGTRKQVAQTIKKANQAKGNMRDSCAIVWVD